MIYKNDDPLFEEGKFVYLKCEVISSTKYFVTVQSAALVGMLQVKKGFMIQKDFISTEKIVSCRSCKICGKLLLPSIDQDDEELR